MGKKLRMWAKKRILPLLLSFALLTGETRFPAVAGETYADTLEGFVVDCVYSDFSRDFVWEAEYDTEKQVKILFTYRLLNAGRDYPEGSLCVVIPGIGNANRASVKKASKLPTDRPDSEWEARWDEVTDTYTFTNRFEVREGQSLSGGFELSWDLASRDTQNGYEQKRSPYFKVEGAGAIALRPLTFRFSSWRDRYRIAMKSSRHRFSDGDDGGYFWYDISTTFDKDWLSRGLLRSTYTVTLETGKETSREDLMVKLADGSTFYPEEGPDGRRAFAVFADRTENIGLKDSTYTNTFALGVRKEGLQGEKITVTGHLDRWYEDETDWVTQAGHAEKVDDSLTLTADDYGFIYDGIVYDHDLWNTEYENYNKPPDYYTYDYFDNRTHEEPKDYTDRLNALNLYNGKVVEFTLRGFARKEYSDPGVTKTLSRASASDAAVAAETESGGEKPAELFSESEEEKEDFDPASLDWDDLHWAEHGLAEVTPWESTGFTYAKVHPQVSLPSATPSDAVPAKASPSDAGEDWEEAAIRRAAFLSEIQEEQEYALVLGDDKLAVYLKDGSVRPLADSEYDFVTVRLPALDGKHVCEIYGAGSQNTPFEEYELLAVKDTASQKTVSLPTGVKAVFVRVNGVAEGLETTLKVGVRLHFDWRAEQEKEEGERVDHENLLVNFSYLRSLYRDGEGRERNDCPGSENSYDGTFGKELAERDETLYGECLRRDYSHVWLRDAVTTLQATASLSPFTRGEEGLLASVKVGGSVQAENAGPLTKFSLYAVLPQGMRARLDSEPVSAEGFCQTQEGWLTDDWESFLSISEERYQGERMIVADFDFTKAPLAAEAMNRVTLTFPVYVSTADAVVYGSRYTVNVYLMVHDDGIDKVAGPDIVTDSFDIDKNGVTTEKMAHALAAQVIDNDAAEWREYVAKYVESAWSEGAVTDTVVQRYREGDTAANNEGSLYEYRLDFGLGASGAAGLVFFDRLEQGAELREGQADEPLKKVESSWQGTFLCVDTSDAERKGFIPTVYYSYDGGQPYDLLAPGWSAEEPDDPSLVKSIAVALNTEFLSGGYMQAGQVATVTVKMRAPANELLVGKSAVNQFVVMYDSYASNGTFEGRDALPSAQTTVTLLESVGKITLQKVDADNILRTDEDGQPHYATLTGGLYQVYDEEGRPLFAKPQSLNALGRLVVDPVSQGIYYWEEIEAPVGYEKIPGRHEFSVEGIGEIIPMENHRLPGSVTLTKRDGDLKDASALHGAVFELFAADGRQIFTDEAYSFDAEGENDTFVTGSSGSFTVSGLPWGTYHFVETKAPAGYEEVSEGNRLSFTIGKNAYDAESDSIHVEVNSYNYQATASLLLKKSDAEDASPVRDAVYDLFREGEEGEEDERILQGLKTDAAGEIEVSGLKFGTYYFVETRNPSGYLLAQGEKAKTEAVTLSAKTAGAVVEVFHEDERQKGDVILVKTDDAGQAVPGAVYDLYYREADEPDRAEEDAQVFVCVGSFTTGTDRQADDYGEIHVENLPWGSYYFLESQAPAGYELSPEKICFTLNRDTVSRTVYLEVTDERSKGSVTLLKVDQADHGKVLAGAEFELYFVSGEKCVPGVDYELAQGQSAIRTDENGRVTLTGLKQGAYYFKEIRAPESYSINTDYIRFSVTKENAGVLMEIAAENGKNRAVLTIDKEINTAYEPFGRPTFLFCVTRDDGLVSFASVTLRPDELSGSASLTLEQGHTYRVEEIPVSRYLLESVKAVQNAVVAEGGKEAVVDLVANDSAEVLFVNREEQFEKYSHSVNAINLIKKAAQLTALTVDYTGPDPITADLPGYDEKEEQYRIPEKDLLVTAWFDDGTQRVLGDKEYRLTPAYIDGTSDSYTGTVSFFANGVQKTAAFSVAVSLPVPDPRNFVTFDCNGGSIEKPGEESLTDSYVIRVKTGTAVNRPQKDPVRENYTFAGWFLDSALLLPALFPYTVTEDTVFTAAWEPVPVSARYAVTLYAIGDSCEAAAGSAGLTFGPALGESYLAGTRSHVPGEGQRCLHGLSWQEIAAQSAENPEVFRECLAHGCTHAVDLCIRGELAENAQPMMAAGGDGASVLVSSVNEAYRVWENSPPVAEGWADSAIRRTLNGGDAALFSSLVQALPEELKNALLSAEVLSSTLLAGGAEKDEVTYDNLWLLSPEELAGRGMTGYSESGGRAAYWLRQAAGEEEAFYVAADGSVSEEARSNPMGIAFGFSLPGPEPTTKVALSLYGIRQDIFREENSQQGVAGLTFGPATGADYTESFVSHVPTGVTQSGNAHRCLHDDDWETIAANSLSDPYVYEQCFGSVETPSCTKGLNLYLNDTLYGESFRFSGDGTGVLLDSLNPESRAWNYHYKDEENGANSRNFGGWPASHLRAVLNGADTYTNRLYDGTEALSCNGHPIAGENPPSKEDCLFTCLPPVLAAHIVPKAVASDTLFSDTTLAHNLITYDRLWLFSTREYWSGGEEHNRRPNEGETYARQTALQIDGNSSTKKANVSYAENGVKGRYFRSIYSDSLRVAAVDKSGNANKIISNSTDCAVGFGFCLR